MKNLSLVIESFSEGENVGRFYKFIIENSNLTDDERNVFSKIYQEAAKFELWNYSDLKIGLKNAQQYLSENTALSEKSIKQICTAISYEWK